MIKWNDTHDEQVRAISDADLIAAYQRMSGEPGVAAPDALVAEIKLRNLDI